MKLDLQTALIGAGALAIVAVGLFIAKKGVAGATAAVVGAAADVASGAVVGIGQAVGIPATNETECERAMRTGDTWGASFACPAGTFLRYVTGSSSPAPQASYDETQRLINRYAQPAPASTPRFDEMGAPIGTW